MTPTEARAAYRQSLEKAGRLVTLRRVASGVTTEAVDCLARVLGYTAEQIVGAVQQGDQRVILLAEDLELKSWPDMPKAGSNPDRIVFDGAAYAIQDVDANTLNPWGVAPGKTVAYEIRIRG
jgi:hypothetical protein